MRYLEKRENIKSKSNRVMSKTKNMTNLLWQIKMQNMSNLLHSNEFAPLLTSTEIKILLK